MSEPTRGETLERMLHASADNFWGKYEAGMRYAASLVRTASDELDAATPPAEGLCRCSCYGCRAADHAPEQPE